MAECARARLVSALSPLDRSRAGNATPVPGLLSAIQIQGGLHAHDLSIRSERQSVMSGCMIVSSNPSTRETSMARRPSNHGNAWTASELKKLKVLARTTTAFLAAKVLGRTPASTQQKAMRAGISFHGRFGPAKKK